MPQEPALYSIGHSNHSPERFLELLEQYGIEVLADVRSAPYSRYSPHFNRRALESRLAAKSIRYVFLGEELGGRPSDDRFYDQEGRVLYGEMASWSVFLDGVKRLSEEAGTSRTIMMCSEGDPSECHRYLLITMVLEDMGVRVGHIRKNGSLEHTRQVPAYNDLMSMTAPTLFGEPGRTTWKSSQPVLRKRRQPNSSSR